MRRLPLRPLVDFAPVLGEMRGDPVIGFAEDGTVLASAHQSLTAREARSHDEPYRDHRVVRWKDGRTDSVLVPSCPVHPSFVQPHPAGYLLAGSRAPRLPDGSRNNAALIATTGEALETFTLGDAVADLRVTPSGAIWASYFDEGVFGGTIAQHGLVQFNSDGAPRWQYEPATADTEPIADVYALNVIGEDAWIYFYPQFCLVRIAGGDHTVWRTDVHGAHAVAVDDNRALFVGKYPQKGSKPSELARGPRFASELELRADGVAPTIREIEIDEPALDFRGRLRYRGVGPRLYGWRGTEVFILDEW